MKKLKTFENFSINENKQYYGQICEVEIDDETLSIIYHEVSPFEISLYAETLDGEPYVDITTIIPTNSLLDAVWVKIDSLEEGIANELISKGILVSTSATTRSGFNTYRKYDLTSFEKPSSQN